MATNAGQLKFKLNLTPDKFSTVGDEISLLCTVSLTLKPNV